MSYSGRPFFRIPRPLLLEGGVESKTLTGNPSLTDKDSLFQIMDGGGSNRVVFLPALKSGRVYMIKNAGASNIIELKNPDNSFVGSLAVAESKWFVCDGINWFVL